MPGRPEGLPRWCSRTTPRTGGARTDACGATHRPRHAPIGPSRATELPPRRGARADREMPMTQPHETPPTRGSPRTRPSPPTPRRHRLRAPSTASGAGAPELTFADLDVHPDIVASLAEHGIIDAFPIQAKTLPVALAGHDIIGQAKTGTGKTFGFGVPILNRVVAPGDEGYAALARPGKPQALVVAPTRELAVQVAGTSSAPAASAASACSPSTAAGPTSPRSRRCKHRRRGRRRHPRSPHRPRQAGPPRPVAGAHRRARRGRRDARPRLPARRRDADVADAGRRARRCSSPRRCRAPSWRSPAAS